MRFSVLVNASRNALLSGQGRMTLGPARKRVIGVWPVSELILRLYSCSTQASVASLSFAKLKSDTSSSMAISVALDGGPEDLDLGVRLGRIGKRRLLQHAEPCKALDDLRGEHGGRSVAQAGARQSALLECLGEAMSDNLGALRQIPLQVTGKARAVVEHAEQDRRLPRALRGEHGARAMMRIEVPEAADVLCLVAPHFAVKQAGLGTLSAFDAPRGDAAPLVEAAGLEEAAQRRIGRQGCEIRIVLRQSREIVVVQPHTPALVGGVLGDDRPAYRAAHRRLPSGVGAQLAAQ